LLRASANATIIDIAVITPAMRRAQVARNVNRYRMGIRRACLCGGRPLTNRDDDRQPLDQSSKDREQPHYLTRSLLEQLNRVPKNYELYFIIQIKRKKKQIS